MCTCEYPRLGPGYTHGGDSAVLGVSGTLVSWIGRETKAALRKFLQENSSFGRILTQRPRHWLPRSVKF